jgi:hypothetical protein
LLSAIDRISEQGLTDAVVAGAVGRGAKDENACMTDSWPYSSGLTRSIVNTTDTARPASTEKNVASNAHLAQGVGNTAIDRCIPANLGIITI